MMMSLEDDPRIRNQMKDRKNSKFKPVAGHGEIRLSLAIMSIDQPKQNIQSPSCPWPKSKVEIWTKNNTDSRATAQLSRPLSHGFVMGVPEKRGRDSAAVTRLCYNVVIYLLCWIQWNYRRYSEPY